jgi:hypothetical protein
MRPGIALLSTEATTVVRKHLIDLISVGRCCAKLHRLEEVLVKELSNYPP